MKNIKEKVYGFKTKYKEGFTTEEVDVLVKECFGFNMEKFNKALTGVTGEVVNGEPLVYHSDVEKALRCGIEDRDLRNGEWD
jgi:hypothetical protein